MLYLLLSLSFFFALDQEKHFYYFMEWIYTFFLFHGVFLYYFILL
ncbi:putative membrane protein [Bacteroides fragilis str. 3986 T(B)9]|uniref:Transmembrane protein n=2 Tax=Bacteroides fragilis TaxID=817 RepID=A0A853PW88_BACFG|nr:putative membrane protein [Bacteroides fragilis str. 2-F-2 \